MPPSLLGIRGAVALVLLAVAVVGCGGKKKDVDDSLGAPGTGMSVTTYQKGMEYLTKRNLRQAKETLERIEYLPGSDSQARIEPLARVALADATFYQGTILGYIDARNLYLDFVTLYGNHPLAPYAQTQAGLCSLKQVNNPAKDQTQTQQAIRDLEDVMVRWPESGFSQAASGYRRIARSNIAQAEFLVGKFYVKRKAYQAAAERFQLILRRYPDFLEVEKVRFFLGKALMLSGDEVQGRLILDQLVTESPQGRYAQQAQKLLGSRGGGEFSTGIDNGLANGSRAAGTGPPGRD